MLNGVDIYPDVPEDIYRSYKAINQSLLKLCDKSLGHFKYWYDRIGEPQEEGEKEDALFIGTAVHAAILEPEKFKARYINSGCPNKTKKEFRDCKSANPDKIVLSSKEYAICEGTLNSISQTSAARKLLELESFNEIVGIWDDPTTGLRCKLRADRYVVLNGEPCIIDVKTTIDASHEGFASSIMKFDYHMQAAFYLDGLSILNPDLGKHRKFIVIAVEKVPPYAVAVHEFDEGIIRDGRIKNRQYLTSIKLGFDTNTWNLYPDTIQHIRFPEWYYRQKQTSSTN